MGGVPDGDRCAEIFLRAIELQPAEREVYVRKEAAGDDEVVAEVLSLLAADHTKTQAGLRSPVEGGAPPPTFGERTLGPYRLLDEIGEGGMGRVYRAEQEQPIRRTVAVKVMRRLAESSGARARFQAEQRVLVRLQHRGIARVLDGGLTPDGSPYLVMDLVDGAPLHQWIAQHEPALATRLDLFVAICEAVQHAHQKGVIHRDLKPSNVLVVLGEDGAEPRVIDFGIARVLTTEHGEETLHTMQDVAMGTAGYMSPEQATDAASADARSDVYALGAILYEMLTGALPRGRVAAGEAAAWQTTPERPSRQAAPSITISQDLDWVILKALAVEPERRYSTVVELVADIARARRFEPVTARAPTVGYVVSRFLRRNRVATSIVLAGLVALLIGTVALLSLWREADRNWNDYRRLVDDKRLIDLRQDALIELWPPWPGTVAAINEWEQAVLALARRRPDIEARSSELQRRLLETAEGQGRDELAYQQEVLLRLVAGLDRLLASEPADDNLTGIRQRRADALRVGRLSLEEPADRWREALASIADKSACPDYAGLEVPGPQVGLVPLGRNHTSGLWEFWHVESGAEPRRRLDDQGHYVGVELDEASGMVFVLVPGGRFTIGALRVGDAHSGTAPIDPQAAPMEQFVHDISLPAFFVSKFETTQGQWLALTGRRPSLIDSSRSTRGHLPDLRHPVEQVTYAEAVEGLRRRGLLLPSEAQWEYFARAGTVTVFGGVERIEDLPKYANLADEGSRGALRMPVEPDYDDGFAMTAPVGSFLPNPWGLHDCHGNVAEWTRDWLVSYTQRSLHEDGYREPIAGEQPTVRVFRGGDFAERKLLSRVASRNAQPEEQRTARTGLRPVRAIQ